MMEPDTHKFLLKLIIVGASSSGKSCLLRQFTERNFSANYNMTIGVEFGSRVLDADGTCVKLQVWDTAGQESFRSIVRSYYRGAVGALVVFDLTSHKSFEDAAAWLADCREHCKTDVSVVLVGNKSDLASQREVTQEEAADYAATNDVQYFETSAKTATNVDAAFVDVARSVLAKIQDGRIDVATLGGPSNRTNPSAALANAAAAGGGGGSKAAGHAVKPTSLSGNNPGAEGRPDGSDKKCCK